MSQDIRIKRRTIVRAIVLGFVALALSFFGTPAGAVDTIAVTIAVDDSEIITTDLRRIRLAAPADIRFKVTTNYIEQVFGKDLSIPRDQMRFAVLSSARRVLGAMTGEQATGPDASRAIVQDIDRALAYLGVMVEHHTLHYTYIPRSAP